MVRKNPRRGLCIQPRRREILGSSRLQSPPAGTGEKAHKNGPKRVFPSTPSVVDTCVVINRYEWLRLATARTLENFSNMRDLVPRRSST
jgi:hypothetical protein